MANTKSAVVPIILAGGRGTRLWPMSRASRPKQFLNLVGEGSLFQQTLQRVSDPQFYSAPVIVTNEEYRFLVAEQAQLVGIKPEKIILEPEARNTAPAILSAVLAISKGQRDRIVFVLPCDHKIETDDAYHCAINNAKIAAGHGNLVTFGVTPTEPAVGFGYIKANGKISTGTRRVESFTEKPDYDTAKQMIASGGYYWNSGMFMLEIGSFLSEARTLAPDVYSAAKNSVSNAKHDLDFFRLDADSFCNSPSISIDHGIFERTDKAAVVEFPVGWSDLGSWNAVWETGVHDEAGNVSSDNVRLFNTSDSIVMSDGVNIVVDGLSDVAIVASEDVAYIGRLSAAQDIGGLVEKLRSCPETAELTENHRTTHRPWGGYTSILKGERYQVKRLFVNPGKSLSLQKHHHRSEHWVVIKGAAEIQIGNDTRVLCENESVYIPSNTVHRLSNPGKILLEVIEVQTGAYLGEDDIIRYEDTFGRK